MSPSVIDTNIHLLVMGLYQLCFSQKDCFELHGTMLQSYCVLIIEFGYVIMLTKYGIHVYIFLPFPNFAANLQLPINISSLECTSLHHLLRSF